MTDLSRWQTLVACNSPIQIYTELQRPHGNPFVDLAIAFTPTSIDGTSVIGRAMTLRHDCGEANAVATFDHGLRIWEFKRHRYGPDIVNDIWEYSVAISNLTSANLSDLDSYATADHDACQWLCNERGVQPGIMNMVLGFRGTLFLPIIQHKTTMPKSVAHVTTVNELCLRYK